MKLPPEFRAWREGSVVTIWWRPTDADDRGFSFEHDFGSAQVAQLMLESLRAGTADRIGSLVRRAYELGWKDKSSKHRKRAYFARCINHVRGDPAW